MQETVCEKCGVSITGGMWPWCPHPMREAKVAMATDEIVGGVTLENWGPNPVTFHSYSEMRRYATEHHIQIREKFAPTPGTDKDPAGIPNPKGYMDPKTLDNARVLLSRVSGQRQEDEVPITLVEGEIDGVSLHQVLTGDLRAQSRLHRRTTGHGK